MRALGACWKIVAGVAEQDFLMACVSAAISEYLARRLTDLTLTDNLRFR